VKKQISASLATLMLLGVFAASSVTAAVPTPGATIPGNYQCTGEDSLKIDPVEAGTYDLPGGGTITIILNGDKTFNFTTDGAVIDSIVVKGGPNYHWYTFVPGVESAEGLHAPWKVLNVQLYGLSHLCIESTKKDSEEDPKK
jgi:hypothetical protein